MEGERTSCPPSLGYKGGGDRIDGSASADETLIAPLHRQSYCLDCGLCAWLYLGAASGFQGAALARPRAGESHSWLRTGRSEGALPGSELMLILLSDCLCVVIYHGLPLVISTLVS